MSLPAQTRHRWDLDAGGEVGYLDLGDAVVIVPGGVEALRRAVLDGITAAGWQAARQGHGDSDLADE